MNDVPNHPDGTPRVEEGRTETVVHFATQNMAVAFLLSFLFAMYHVFIMAVTKI